MSDEQMRKDFIEAILAAPDGDASLLVYADWLEQRGDTARAEFVRVQCALERTPTADVLEIMLHSRVLWEEHSKRWFADLSLPASARVRGLHRGVALCVDVPGLDSLRACAAACRESAPLHRARVGGINPAHIDDTRIPSLRELIIEEPMETEAYPMFAEMPLLATIRELSIDGSWMSDLDLRILLASPHLGSLTALRLPDNGCGAEGVRALAESRGLTLTALDLSTQPPYTIGSAGGYAGMGSEGIAALAAWPSLASVRDLDLSGHTLVRSDLLALLESPHAARLEALRLDAVGDEDLLDAFEGAHPDLHLQMLSLGEQTLTVEGCERLASARCLSGLEVLEIRSCEVSAEAFERLWHAPWYDRLRILHTQPSASLLRSLCARPPRALHSLSLFAHGSEILDLLASPLCDKLRSLSLGSDDSDIMLAALAGSEGMSRLMSLSLWPNEILRPPGVNEALVAALARSPLGTRLVSRELGFGGKYSRLVSRDSPELYHPRRFRARP